MKSVFIKSVYFTASLLFTYHLTFAQETSKESTAEKRAQSSVTSSAFKALHDGKEVIFNTVLAYTYGGKGVRVEFSTAHPTCKDFGGFGRALSQGEKTLSMTIAPLIAEDGSSSWQIRTLYFSGRNLTEQGGVSVKVNDFPKGPIQFEIDRAIEFKANDFMEWKRTDIVLKGTVNAKSCGTFQRNKGAVSKPQKDLKVLLAGHSIDIRGAMITHSYGKTYLKLASQPIDCKSSSIGNDLFLEFELNKDGRSGKHLLANGDLIRQNLNVNLNEERPFKVTGPEGYLTEVGEHKVSVQTKLDLFGLPLSIDGQVVVTTCKR